MDAADITYVHTAVPDLVTHHELYALSKSVIMSVARAASVVITLNNSEWSGSQKPAIGM